MTRLRTLLTILFPTLLGVFAILLFWRYYSAPIIFPDTFGYLAGAAPDPARSIAGTRTPVYGWLMLQAFHVGIPALIVWVQQALWLSCIATGTWLVLTLTESWWRAIGAGAALIGADILTMHMLPSTWFFLTDASAALCTTLGLFLVLIGAVKKNSRILWLGAGCIGLSNIIRPLFVGMIVGSLAIVGTSRIIKHSLLSRSVIIAMMCVWLPTIGLCTYNWFQFGFFSTSSVSGRYVMTYTLALLQPGDKVFDDEKLNAALHETVRTGSVPEAYRGIDAYDIGLGKHWHELSELYGSLAHDDNVAVMRFKVKKLSTSIMLRNVWQHPNAYVAMVWGRLIHNILPDQTGAHYFTFETQDGYGVQEKHWTTLLRNKYLTETSAMNRTPHNPDTVPVLRRIIAFALPKTIDTTVIALFLGTMLFSFGTSVFLITKSHSQQRNLLGYAIMICIFASVLYSLAQAMIVNERGVLLAEDPRQRLPALMTTTMAIILSLSAIKRREYSKD